MAGFPRHHRLLRPAEYRFVFERATRAGDQFVTVLARPNDLPFGRLGLAVGRRRIALSTRRNTFKRVVRESFRAHPGYTAGLDIVVLPKPAAAKAERADLRASIDRQWRILHQRLART